MDRPCAYLITWTVRGTWLHGDPRGSVDRLHNRFRAAYLPADHVRRSAQSSRLREPAALLDADARTVVSEAIDEACRVRGWRMLTVAVRSNHVHVVIVADAVPERVMQDLKSWSTRALRRADPFRCGAPWTRHGSTRYLWDPLSVSGAIRSVRSQDERGGPSPRAHARGSDGGPVCRSGLTKPGHGASEPRA